MDILVYCDWDDSWRAGKLLAIRKGVVGAVPYDGTPLDQSAGERMLVWCKGSKDGSPPPQALDTPPDTGKEG